MHYRKDGSEKDACSDWRDVRRYSSPAIMDMLLAPLKLDEMGCTHRLDDVQCVLCACTLIAEAHREYRKA